MQSGDLASTAVLLTFMTLPTVITQGLGVMGCSEPIGGISYLRLDYSVQCYTQ